MLVRSYIDESSGPNRTFALGCAIAKGTEWTWINRDWKKCLERKNRELKGEGRKCISRYHASDCDSRRGDFLGWNVPEKTRFVTELIGILTRYHMHFIGFTLDLTELRELFPQIDQRFAAKAAYGALAWLIFPEIANDARHLEALTAEPRCVSVASVLLPHVGCPSNNLNTELNHRTDALLRRLRNTMLWGASPTLRHREYPSTESNCSGAHKKEKATLISERGLYQCRQRPTLPHTFACSTIGPAGLNFRVRDGNGWIPRGKITDNS